MSTIKINTYEVCLFNKWDFPYLGSSARTHPTTLFSPLQLPTTDYGSIEFSVMDIVIVMMLSFVFTLVMNSMVVVLVMMIVRFFERHKRRFFHVSFLD